MTPAPPAVARSRRRGALRAVVLFLALLLAAAAGGIWWAAASIRVPPWRLYDGPKLADGFGEPNAWAQRFWAVMRVEDLPFPHEKVEAAAVDGKTLRGWLLPAAAPTDAAVLLVHGGGADRRSMLKYVTFLHDAGYAVGLFDLRDHGLSDGDRGGCTFGKRETEDVESMVGFLAGRGLCRIAVLGDSVGGASAILAGRRDLRIGAVISQNAYADFESFVEDILEARFVPRRLGNVVAKVCERTWPADPGNVRPDLMISGISPRPVLILHGEKDTLSLVSHAHRLYEAALEPKELWIVPGAGHATLWNADRAGFESRVLAFLARSIGKPGGKAATAACEGAAARAAESARPAPAR